MTKIKSNKTNILKSTLEELIDYRDLLYFLVKRDVNAIYKQTILGFSWAIIRPLVQMVVFTLIFGKLAGIEKSISSELPYALFSYIALVPWTYFSTSLVGSSSSLVNNANLFTKVYFPRLIIPLTPVIAKLVDFVIAFTIIILMMVYYGFTPDWKILYIPLMVILMIITSMGMGLWLSAMSIQYRDVNQLMQFGVQLLMYAAPVIWPLSYIPERFHLIYGFYPLAGVIEGFRACLIKGYSFNNEIIISSCVSAAFIFITGVLYFRRKEKFFTDVA